MWKRPENKGGNRWCNYHKDYHPIIFFNKNNTTPDGLQYYCKEGDRFFAKKSGLERKRKVFEHYGNKCACCGLQNDPLRTLTIGHPNGDGKFHRLEIGNGSKVYAAILKKNFKLSHEIRLECFGCNFIAGTGKCPYEGKEHPWTDNLNFKEMK